MSILDVYLIGALAFAAWAGFDTPRHSTGGLIELIRIVMFALSWPILVAAGLGHACRLFSRTRTLEDWIGDAKK